MSINQEKQKFERQDNTVYLRIVFCLCLFILLLMMVLLVVLNQQGVFSSVSSVKTSSEITDTYWIEGEQATLMYQKDDTSGAETLGLLTSIKGISTGLSSDASYALLGRPTSSTLLFGVKKDLFESRIGQLFTVSVPSLVAASSSIPSLLGTFGDGRYGIGDVDRGADTGDVIFYDLATASPIKNVHVDLTKTESFDPGCAPSEPTAILSEDGKTVTIRVYQNDDFITCRPLVSEMDVPF